MTKDEALKLALEALDCICSPLHVREIEKIGSAMKAIKEVLAQPEQESDDLTIAYMSGVYDGKNKDTPQPEQELVLWRNAAIRVGEDLCSVGPFGYYDMTAKQWLDWALSVVTVHAPPPQRTWVGLTDEQIGAILEDPSIAEKHQGNWLVLPYAYARAIEAAHGIKGE